MPGSARIPGFKGVKLNQRGVQAMFIQNADATRPEKQLLSYWQYAEQNGRKPKPVYVIFERSHGSIVTWSTSRRDMTRWLDKAIIPGVYQLSKCSSC
jgi:hypothetical protein